MNSQVLSSFHLKTLLSIFLKHIFFVLFWADFHLNKTLTDFLAYIKFPLTNRWELLLIFSRKN